ncbi:hypothetical protein L9F63_011129 [Diploptera punctata]|uniref:Tetraspanin n=1 Tax=Diploptera punctata TaxID=6984 RepID=A0AAD8AFN7_DIPPU|nr:hypothetical protein L9F63_011129 [Diploptera punctata]
MQLFNNMTLSGGPAYLKYLLFVFNLVFVITGIALLSIGAVVQGLYYQYYHFLDDKYLSAPALLIAIGAIILIVCFLGCCGAIKENHCMIISFSVVLAIIFIMELSGGIAGYVLRNDAADVLRRKLNETADHYVDKSDVTAMWDYLQTELQCCGVGNFTDWEHVFKNDSLPLSCCARLPGMTGIQNCTVESTTSHVYTVGCIQALGNFVRDHAAVIGGSGIGIAFIQVSYHK